MDYNAIFFSAIKRTDLADLPAYNDKSKWIKLNDKQKMNKIIILDQFNTLFSLYILLILLPTVLGKLL